MKTNLKKTMVATVLIVILMHLYGCVQTQLPVIGISAGQPSGTGENYVKAVRRAGGVPMVITMTDDQKELERILQIVDGVILTGGQDVDPARYGESPVPELGKVCPERDAFDVMLVTMAVEAGLPVLGICRGSQVMNVAFGGSLYQDIPSQLPDTYLKHRVNSKDEFHHDVKISEGTLLHKMLGTSASVNSSHHQSVKDVAPGFIVSAVSEDGVVEAIEKKDAPFVVGVQFHPEGFVAAGNDSLMPIFSHFISATSR